MNHFNSFLALCAMVIFGTGSVFSQWEMAYGHPSNPNQGSKTKGDTITWLGENCYISARRDCSTANCYTVFHIVDEYGCPTAQSTITASKMGIGNNVFISSVKAVGPMKFAYTGYTLYSGPCGGKSDLVIGYYDASLSTPKWVREFGDEDTREIGNDLIIDSDGNIVVTGYGTKLNCSGSLNKFQAQYLLMAKVNIYGMPTPDGGVRLYREDQVVTSASPTYTRNFGYYGNAIIEQDNPDIKSTRPWLKEYVVAGLMIANSSSTIPGNEFSSAFVMRIEPDLNIPKLDAKKRFPFNRDSEAYDLALMPSGRIIVAGKVDDLFANLGGTDAFLADFPADLKTSGVGINYNIFGGEGDDEARNILYDGVQSYFVSGNTASFRSSMDVFLFRGTFDSNNNLVIQSRPFPNPGSVGVFGSLAKDEYNHNMVFDTRDGLNAFHLFNARGSLGSEQHPDYRVHTNIGSLATNCDEGENFATYDEGTLIPTNIFTFEEEFRFDIGGLLNGMVQINCLDICNGCVSHKTSSDGKTLEDSSVAIEGLSVFPNPAQDVLNIQTAEAIQGVVIMDAFGRSVLSLPVSGETSTSLSLETLSSGIYFVQITTDVSVETVEIIKE